MKRETLTHHCLLTEVPTSPSGQENPHNLECEWSLSNYQRTGDAGESTSHTACSQRNPSCGKPCRTDTMGFPTDKLQGVWESEEEMEKNENKKCADPIWFAQHPRESSFSPKDGDEPGAKLNSNFQHAGKGQENALNKSTHHHQGTQSLEVPQDKHPSSIRVTGMTADRRKRGRRLLSHSTDVTNKSNMSTMLSSWLKTNRL